MKTRIGLPCVVGVGFLIVWHLSVRLSGSDLFPTPLDVFLGVVELIRKGLLLKYIVASLFRVTVGFGLAVLLGIPLGLLLGWFQTLFFAFNPMIQCCGRFRRSPGSPSRSCGSGSTTAHPSS